MRGGASAEVTRVPIGGLADRRRGNSRSHWRTWVSSAARAGWRALKQAVVAARTVKVRGGSRWGPGGRAARSPPLAHCSAGRPRSAEGAGLRQAQCGPLAAAARPAHREELAVREAPPRLAEGHRRLSAAAAEGGLRSRRRSGREQRAGQEEAVRGWLKSFRSLSCRRSLFSVTASLTPFSLLTQSSPAAPGPCGRRLVV